MGTMGSGFYGVSNGPTVWKFCMVLKALEFSVYGLV